MDIQTEKLFLIEQLAKLDDVDILNQIKQILQNVKSAKIGSEPNGQTITQADLIQRAEISNRAILDGDITSVEDLEKESKNW
ncbi:hypothetical protein SAMN04488029_3073 [Reichenbachiella faecimaris]|uniref:Uncharacterized protein n=1 Tax=Reichenbachiella faecimaris TaxID=692418 RepID=A0A1W2GJR6_REIFA|nr:hypothetical protein [Reichenbachiella faecimaris]SMD36794.1 hypothetical protein SAMN04488029_3073 [Reichenbachiella faecimaris]